MKLPKDRSLWPAGYGFFFLWVMSYAPAGAVLKEVHYKEPGPRTAIDLISTSQLIWLSANEPVLFPGEFLKKYMASVYHN